MPKLRRLSGTDVLAFFERIGFSRIGQRGTHVKVRRVVEGQRQTLVVPLHRELDTGTCRALMREASRYVAEAELHRFFYTQD